MKLLINEMPYSSHVIGMFARKNGKYTRPIISKFTDMRFEDFMQKGTIEFGCAYVGALPNIKEIGQVDKYLLADANLIARADLTLLDITQMSKTKKCVFLPDNWWEYAACMDANNKYIKAPLLYRDGEPSPEEIDERLDDFPKNIGRLDVVSPQVFLNQQDYKSKLNLI